MAHIVLVGDKMVRTGMEAGDVVSIHDSDVNLAGPGYKLMQVIHVEGMTAQKLKVILNARIPKVETAHRLPAVGQWCFLEQKQVWKDKDGKWNDLVNRPKFQLTLKNLTEEDIAILKDETVSIEEKEAILSSKTQDKISLDKSNLNEVTDLNDE